MNFQTGIALSQEAEHDFIVAAVTWFNHTTPHFTTRGLTLPFIKENLLATIVVSNTSQTKTMNACCHRTIEKLLIRGWIKPGEPPGIVLLTKPVLAKKHFMLPCKKTKTHWLLNAADTVLMAWLRGER